MPFPAVTRPPRLALGVRTGKELMLIPEAKYGIPGIPVCPRNSCGISPNVGISVAPFGAATAPASSWKELLHSRDEEAIEHAISYRQNL